MPALAVNFKNTIVDSQQTLFSSPATGAGTRIDSLTVVNNGNVNAAYSLYIDNGISDDVPIIPDKIVVWGDIDLGVGLVNQVIPPSAIIRVESTALNALYFTMTGVNIDS